MDYATTVDCIDIDNPECLCDACRDFFENGFNEIVKAEGLPIFKFNPFVLDDISNRMNSDEIKTYYLAIGLSLCGNFFTRIVEVKAIKINENTIRETIKSNNGLEYIEDYVKPHWFDNREEAVTYLSNFRDGRINEVIDQIHSLRQELIVLSELNFEENKHG